jgi:hypothetical protein
VSFGQGDILRSFYILPETLHLKELEKLSFVGEVLKFALQSRLRLDPRSRIGEHNIYVVLGFEEDEEEGEQIARGFDMLDSFTSGYMACANIPLTLKVYPPSAALVSNRRRGPRSK